MNRVMVAGVGNIFLADDGFGVEVARRMSADVLPPESRPKTRNSRDASRVSTARGLRHAHSDRCRPAWRSAWNDLRDRPDLDAEPVNPATDAHSMNPEAVLSTSPRSAAEWAECWL